MWAGWEPYVDVAGVLLVGVWAIRWALRQEAWRQVTGGLHNHEEGARVGYCAGCEDEAVMRRNRSGR